jgi:accessory gene regulator B
MGKLVGSAVSYLISLGSVAENDRDIYEYGLHLLLSLSANLAVTLLIGVIFGMSVELLFMFLPFIALRTVSGGYHAGSFGRCVAVSAVAVVSAIAAIRFAPESARFPVAAGLSAFTFAIVYFLAPVSHPNRPLDAAEIHRFRRQSRIAVIAAIAASQLLFLTRVPLYGFSISIGIALSGAATFVAAVRKRGGEYGEEKV